MTPEDYQQHINPLRESNNALYEALAHHKRRLDLLEGIFKHVLELNIRVDTLEFESHVPVRPAISEKFLDMQLRLTNLESFLLKKEQENV